MVPAGTVSSYHPSSIIIHLHHPLLYPSSDCWERGACQKMGGGCLPCILPLTTISRYGTGGSTTSTGIIGMVPVPAGGTTVLGYRTSGMVLLVAYHTSGTGTRYLVPTSATPVLDYLWYYGTIHAPTYYYVLSLS